MGFLSDLSKGVTEGLGGGLVSGAFDIAGGLLSSHSASKAQQREYERQKEFAQNGIRWKVEDAKAAGIHPLYAIGASGATYTPQASSGTDYGLHDMGQSISGAIESRMTARERERQQLVREESDSLDLRHKRLLNRKLEQEIHFAEHEFLWSQNSTVAQRNRSIPPTPTQKPAYIDLVDKAGNVVDTVPSSENMRRMSPEANVLAIYDWWFKPKKELGGYTPFQLWLNKYKKNFGIGKYFRPWTSKRDQ